MVSAQKQDKGQREKRERDEATTAKDQRSTCYPHSRHLWIANIDQPKDAMEKTPQVRRCRQRRVASKDICRRGSVNRQVSPFLLSFQAFTPRLAHVLFSSSSLAQNAVDKLHAHVFKGSLLSVTLKKRLDTIKSISYLFIHESTDLTTCRSIRNHPQPSKSPHRS